MDRGQFVSVVVCIICLYLYRSYGLGLGGLGGYVSLGRLSTVDHRDAQSWSSA